MASFKDKIKKTTKATTQSGDRVYFPKTLGMYTIPNPKVDKREFQPEVLAVPPVHRTTSISFKGESLSNVSYWLGKLLMDPVVINMGHFPAAALHQGTDELIFPDNRSGFDKKIPLIGEEVGVHIPETYDLLVPVQNERANILKKLNGPNVSDKRKKYLQGEMEKLNAMKDGDFLRTSHEVQRTVRMFVPLLTTVVTEEEDEDTAQIKKKFTPTVAIFEQACGVGIGETLQGMKVIDNKYDPSEVVEYLFGDIDDCAGENIMVFKNPSVLDGKKSPVLCAQVYNEKIGALVKPYFDVQAPAPITDRQLFRIVVLEMVGLFGSKNSPDSIESMLKKALYDEIKAESEAPF